MSMANWVHPYAGVFRRRMSSGWYGVERSMDDQQWRAWWYPDGGDRIGLTATGRRTAREASNDAMSHYWKN